MANTLERMRAVLAKALSVESNKIVPGARFKEDLNADSLDLVEAIMALEEEFGVEIPDAEAQGMKTVQDVLDWLEKKAKA